VKVRQCPRGWNGRELYGDVAQPATGLAILEEALELVEKNDERWYTAELYRLKGELLLALSVENQSEADTCFRQSIDLARRQQAKSLELRAAMSLSQLWQHQGMRYDTRQVLSEVYAWFTEGYDTTDLQEAKTILAALGAECASVPVLGLTPA
jgi:predicted ATPase